MNVEDYGLAMQIIEDENGRQKDLFHIITSEIPDSNTYPFKYYLSHNSIIFAYVKENIQNLTVKIYGTNHNSTILIDKNKNYHYLGRTNAILSKIIYALSYIPHDENLVKQLTNISTTLIPRKEKDI